MRDCLAPFAAVCCLALSSVLMAPTASLKSIFWSQTFQRSSSASTLSLMAIWASLWTWATDPSSICSPGLILLASTRSSDVGKNTYTMVKFETPTTLATEKYASYTNHIKPTSAATPSPKCMLPSKIRSTQPLDLPLATTDLWTSYLLPTLLVRAVVVIAQVVSQGNICHCGIEPPPWIWTPWRQPCIWHL